MDCFTQYSKFLTIYTGLSRPLSLTFVTYLDTAHYALLAPLSGSIVVNGIASINVQERLDFDYNFEKVDIHIMGLVAEGT